MIETTGDDLVVIADNPHEMVEAQHATIEAVGRKLEIAKNDAADAIETLKHLTDAGMSTRAAERIVKRADSRVEFLDKAKQALEAGYVIVPEMPCDVVAIRVKRGPKHQHETNDYGYTPTLNEEAAKGLPAGEGQYVDPLPNSDVKKFDSKDAKGNAIVRVHRLATDWNTDIALPVEFLRPTVVERTGKVMMRKVFDEIAVVGASSSYQSGRAKKADPMVVGSVIDRVAKRKLWFLVAWFVDTKDI